MIIELSVGEFHVLLLWNSSCNVFGQLCRMSSGLRLCSVICNGLEASCLSEFVDRPVIAFRCIIIDGDNRLELSEIKVLFSGICLRCCNLYGITCKSNKDNLHHNK